MPIEIDFTHRDSRSWLANDEPTKYSRLGEPLSDEAIQQGVDAKLRQDIEDFLERQEADLVRPETLNVEFTPEIRSQVASEVLIHLAEADLDVVQYYKDVQCLLEEERELEGSELITATRKQTAKLLLQEEIPADVLTKIVLQVVNRHQDPVDRMIKGLERSNQNPSDDISYTYDKGRETVRVEQTG